MYKTLPFSLYMQPKEHLDQLKSPVKHFALVVCLCVALINCNTWRDLNYFKDAGTRCDSLYNTLWLCDTTHAYEFPHTIDICVCIIRGT